MSRLEFFVTPGYGDLMLRDFYYSQAVRIGERVGLRFRPPRDLRYAAQRIDEWPERPSRFRFDALPVEDLGA